MLHLPLAFYHGLVYIYARRAWWVILLWSSFCLTPRKMDMMHQRLTHHHQRQRRAHHHQRQRLAHDPSQIKPSPRYSFSSSSTSCFQMQSLRVKASHTKKHANARENAYLGEDGVGEGVLVAHKVLDNEGELVMQAPPRLHAPLDLLSERLCCMCE
jgi:hypothetical protein